MFTTFLTSIGMLSGLSGLALGGYAVFRVREISSESQSLAHRTVSVNASGVDPRAVRDVAVLHYDALEEMSGARSFSLALLNSDGDGVVLTSINGRTESRTYAKPITRGDADTLLSPEEYRVIRSARLGDGVGAPVLVPTTPPSEDVAAVDAGASAGVGVGGDDGAEKAVLVTVLRDTGKEVKAGKAEADESGMEAARRDAAGDPGEEVDGEAAPALDMADAMAVASGKADSAAGREPAPVAES